MSKTSRIEIEKHLSQIDMSPYTALPATMVNARTVCYFDNEGIFHRSRIEDVYGKVKGIVKRKGYYYLGEEIEAVKLNHGFWNRVIGGMKEGDSYEDLLCRCEEVRVSLEHSLSWLERFVAKIDKPYFELAPDNPGKDTFDYVRLYIFLSDLGMDTAKAVKENLHAIVEMGLHKIETYSGFQHYGVPISCLKLKQASLTKQKVLILLFERKEGCDGK